VNDVVDNTNNNPQGAPRKPVPPRDRTKSARRRAREFALQGLYEWQLNPRETSSIENQLRGPA
jgi:transcription termination factor NusB